MSLRNGTSAQEGPQPEQMSLGKAPRASVEGVWASVDTRATNEAAESQQGLESREEASRDRSGWEGPQVGRVPSRSGPPEAARSSYLDTIETSRVRLPPANTPSRLWEGVGEDLRKRLKRYAKAKVQTGELADWIREHVPGEKHRASQIIDCGGWLQFRRVIETGNAHLYRASFCKSHLLCQFCAIRRGARTLQAYVPKVLAARLGTPGARLLMVTLTIRNGPELRERFAHLKGSIDRLMWRWRNAQAGRSRASELGAVLGGMGAVEVKRGKRSGEWHPHFHMVLLTRRRLLWDSLIEEWNQITGDSWGVQFQHLDTEQRQRTGEPLSSEEFKAGLARDLVEVFKYPVKFAGMRPEDTWHAFTCLKGKRLIRSFGEFYGVKVPASLLDAPVDWSCVDYEQLTYQFEAGHYWPREKFRPTTSRDRIGSLQGDRGARNEPLRSKEKKDGKGL